MKAGDLNKRITFQMISGYTADENNKKTPTWTDVATVWAKVETKGGKLFYAAQKVNEETTAVFIIRRRADVTTDMQILYGNKTFKILPPIDITNDSILISAKEVV